MTAVKIEKGVTLPPRKYSGRPWKWPFPEMKVGELFAVPKDTNPDSFRNRAVYASAKLQRKFTTRKMEDGTLRCWRVS
jgi:hypothetical protein